MARRAKPKCLPVRGAHACVRVDPDVFDRASAHSWHMHKGYPATTSGSGRAAQKVYLHRFAVDAGAGTIIDHKNGDRLDARRENLRLATKKQNSANTRAFATNRSGAKGVVQRGKRFRAFIHEDGRTVNIGTFGTKKAAACAYDREARKRFGQFAGLNGACDGDD